MARTYRNRHTVPAGYTVLDGGRIIRTGEGRDPSAEPSRYRRSVYCCESRNARKLHQRRFRARSRQWLRIARQTGDFDAPPLFHRTSGWLTW